MKAPDAAPQAIRAGRGSGSVLGSRVACTASCARRYYSAVSSHFPTQVDSQLQEHEKRVCNTYAEEEAARLHRRAHKRCTDPSVQPREPVLPKRLLEAVQWPGVPQWHAIRLALQPHLHRVKRVLDELAHNPSRGSIDNVLEGLDALLLQCGFCSCCGRGRRRRRGGGGLHMCHRCF